MKTLTTILIFISTIVYAQQPLKIFISTDMEGVGGVGTPKTVQSGGKDYTLARKFMTEEVNAVVATIYDFGNAEILINDSHGDMQNLLFEELDPRVKYIQGNIKPLGMVQGLDESFDAVIFMGYHAMAGTEGGFLAHTGSGSVKGLWINGVEVGEGGLNAHYAGAMGVPVILASGDKKFTEQFGKLVPGAKTVATKEAIGFSSAKMIHPEKVREDFKIKTTAALKDLKNAKPLNVQEPTTFRIKVANPTRADLAMGIPGMKRIDGYTIEFTANDMDAAYRVIRIVYKYLSW